MSEIDSLRELQWRLNSAAERLAKLAEENPGPVRTRLAAKREGVLMAESYVADAIRLCGDQ